MTIPAYPGYGSACNGCGACCLACPCKISVTYGLWEMGKGCRALRNVGDRYLCAVVSDPRSVRHPVISGASQASREAAIGTIGICDSRHAWTLEEMRRVLAERNVFDKVNRHPGNTYPRAGVLHNDDGTLTGVEQSAPDGALRVGPLVDGYIEFAGAID